MDDTKQYTSDDEWEELIDDPSIDVFCDAITRDDEKIYKKKEQAKKEKKILR